MCSSDGDIKYIMYEVVCSVSTTPVYAKTHVVTTLSSEEAALRLGIIMKLLLRQNYRFDVFFYFPVSVKNICNGKYTPMPSDNNGWSLYKAVVQSFWNCANWL